jgi:hypothetical protein
MFDKKSRYFGLEPYEVVDQRGRKVVVVPVPRKPNEVLLGYHARGKCQASCRLNC